MNNENALPRSTGYRCGACCAPPGKPHFAGCMMASIDAAAGLAADMLSELDTSKLPLAVPAAIGVLRTALADQPVAAQVAMTDDESTAWGQIVAKLMNKHAIKYQPGLAAFTESLHAAAVAAQAEAASQAERVAKAAYGPVHVVGDLVRNLLTLDQAMPIHAAFHVDFDGKRRCRTRPVIVSRERVIDGKWVDVTRKDVPYAAIVWAKPQTDEAFAATPERATAPADLNAAVEQVTHALSGIDRPDLARRVRAALKHAAHQPSAQDGGEA